MGHDALPSHRGEFPDLPPCPELLSVSNSHIKNARLPPSLKSTPWDALVRHILCCWKDILGFVGFLSAGENEGERKTEHERKWKELKHLCFSRPLLNHQGKKGTAGQASV